jgi:hypothetical protein
MQLRHMVVCHLAVALYPLLRIGNGVKLCFQHVETPGRNRYQSVLQNSRRVLVRVLAAPDWASDGMVGAPIGAGSSEPV